LPLAALHFMHHINNIKIVRQKTNNRPLINSLAMFLILACGLARAESVNYISLNTGLDNDNGSLFDAFIDIAFTEELRISLGLGENTAESTEGSFTTKQQQVSITGNHKQSTLSALTWSLSYRIWGKKGTIETQDSNISIGYFFSNNWHLSLDYETGKLELFIKPEFASRVISINSDRNAWRLTTGFNHNAGSFWLSFLQREYEENLSAINQQRRLQRAIKNIALNQAYALSKEELTLGYEWLFETLDMGIDYSRLVSVIDNHRNHYASIYTRFYVGQNLTVNLRIEQEVNDHFTVYIAGIGFAW